MYYWLENWTFIVVWPQPLYQFADEQTTTKMVVLKFSLPFTLLCVEVFFDWFGLLAALMIS